MAELTRFDLPALVLLVVGLGIVGASGLVMFDVATDEYRYTVTEVSSPADVPDHETIRSAESLSTAARDAFLEARSESDGEFTSTEKVDGLRYSTDAGQGIYYVRYEGALYRFEAATTDVWGEDLLLLVLGAVPVPLGTLAAIVGGLALWRDRNEA